MRQSSRARSTEVDHPVLSVVAVSPVAEAGGAEVLLTDVLCGLVRLRCRVTLVVMGRGPLPELARQRGLHVAVGPPLSFKRFLSAASHMRWLRRFVIDERPDVVLASHAKGQLITRMACAGTGSVQVTQLYDPPATSASSRLAARLGGLRLAISEETAEAHVSRNRRVRPVVIRPGRDLGALRTEALVGDPEAAWQRAGLAPKGPRIVTVTRLQRFKGPFEFIDMAARVLLEQPSACFLVIGPDSPIEPGLRQELETYITNRGLATSVAVAGELSSPDLSATVAGATLLVHPAVREPFGMAIVEALSLGTPVVAYDAPGPHSIIGHGGGALVPVGDVGRLAEVVSSSIADSALLGQWRAQAPGVAKKFDVTTTAQRYLEVLRHAAEAPMNQGETPPLPLSAPE